MARLKKRICRRERSRLVFWLRDGKSRRLLRLADAAAYVQDNEILMLNVENFQAKALSNYMVQQEFPLSTEVEQDLSDLSQTLSLSNLPELVLMHICGCLSVSDIVHLKDVNKVFKNFINHTYVPLLVLPFPTDAFQLIQQKRVLQLTSCCNLSWIPGIRDLEPFKSLNLNFLRELKLVGQNYDWYNQTLSKDYIVSLEFLLQSLNKSSLHRLEILTDGTSDYLHLLNMLKAFKNLQELNLHGFRNSFTVDYDGVWKNSIKNILECVLANTTVKRLNLTNFQPFSMEKGFVIESDTLEELVIECKEFPIEKLKLPQMKVLTIDAMFWPMGNKQEFTKKVFDGCPKLKLFNNIDVDTIDKDINKLIELCNFRLYDN
eukprot:GFUD01032738.1.p1 GENE.GFUD01032738.1~~GFUD01032738.1.p1  ORF type:complete len:375 (+),score=58.48 GFUD01032738.1:44-1168(+)